MTGPAYLHRHGKTDRPDTDETDAHPDRSWTLPINVPDHHDTAFARVCRRILDGDVT
jgi:hypothetical protein